MFCFSVTESPFCFANVEFITVDDLGPLRARCWDCDEFYIGNTEDVCRNIRSVKLMTCFPKCVLLSCLSPQFVCPFLLSYDGQRKRVFRI